MNSLKPYLVDVPVKINIWIRTECQRKQFEVLKQARPSIIFLQSDGGRNEKEWAAIYENRRIYDEEIDWECEIHRLYEEKNNGMYAMSKKATSYIWERVDRCIFLEDDIIPSVDFFQYCAELLEEYKDDLRIERICGANQLGKSENVCADYFFARNGSIWGFATWKRAVEMRDMSFEYAKDPYVMELLKKRTQNNKFAYNQIVGYPKNSLYGGHVASGEFHSMFALYGYNQLRIIPKVNLICCMGATENAAHSAALKNLPKGIRRIFNMETYRMSFPIRHTKYVIPDEEYDRKVDRIFADNRPLIKFSRKIEVWMHRVLTGEFIKYLKRAVNRKLNGEK